MNRQTINMINPVAMQPVPDGDRATTIGGTVTAAVRSRLAGAISGSTGMTIIFGLMVTTFLVSALIGI